MNFEIDTRDPTTRELAIVLSGSEVRRTENGKEVLLSGQMQAQESFDLANDMLFAISELMPDDDMRQRVRDLQLKLELDWDRLADPMPHEGGRS